MERAALYRFEGTISPRPTLTAAAWMSLNSQHVRARLLGLSSFVLAVPLTRRDPTRATRLAWSALSSMSEDRLIVLGEIYARDHLIDALSPVGCALIERSRARGHRIILLSDNLDVVVRPIAEHLGIATGDVICNTMELDDRNFATGVLREPAFGREVGGRALKSALAERGVDLNRACAYGTAAGDAVMLGAAELACAVTPDRDLRRMARDLDWPIVEQTMVDGTLEPQTTNPEVSA